jgi:hypothetical protein
MRIVKTLAAAALLCSGAAQAKPGCVFQDAALRSGPGSSEYLIGVIPANSSIVLVRRGEKWSIVSYDGETGYLATRHLSRERRGAGDPPTWRESMNPGRTLIREIDPLFGDARPFGGPRRVDLGFTDYFSGFRRASWTDRTRDPATAARAPSGPCVVATTKGDRHER